MCVFVYGVWVGMEGRKTAPCTTASPGKRHDGLGALKASLKVPRDDMGGVGRGSTMESERGGAVEGVSCSKIL